MAENAGGIYYDVEMNIQGLLTAQQRVNQRLDLMERSFDSTTRSVENTERSMSSLSRVAVALAGALSVQQVAQYADAWATVNNKLSNSLRPSEQLADVTERVFNITQQTRGSLDATASLYARLERATRQYGTSAGDLAKLTTIINQGFVVSGATAQEAENAIIQLSQGLASGALRGEEFNSVNEQGNRLIVALADSMGVSIGQMRNMAAQGKLTTDVVVNGLLSQGSTIGAEFANTTTTISQALQVAGNNITKFFGENSSVKTGASIFNDAVVTASENIGVLSGVLTAAAAVMGSRYVGALTLSAAAQFQSAIASQKQATANNLTAQSALVAANSSQRKALADKEAALSSLALAQAEYNVAKGSAAEMLAMDALINAKSRASAASLTLAQAENAQAAASTRAAAASNAASVGFNAAGKALSLVGGPAGLAMLAATAVYYFYQKMQQAKQESIDFADSLDGLTAKMKEMSATQISAAIAKTEQSILDQRDAISDLRSEYAQLEQKKTFIEQSAQIRGAAAVSSDLADVNRELAIQAGKVDEAETKLSRTKSSLTLLTAQANGQFREGIDLLRRDGQQAGITAGIMNNLGAAINFAAQAKGNFNASSLMVSRSEDGDKLLANLTKQNELLSITDKRERAVAEARQAAMDAGVDEHSNQMRQIEEQAAKKYDLQKADSSSAKASRASAKTTDDATNALNRQSQAIARLNTGYAEGSLELAKYDARMALGANASTKAIEQSDAQTEAIWKKKEAIRAVAEEEQKRQQAGQNFTGLQGQASPVAGVDNQFQQQMEQLNQYATLYPQKIAEVEAVRASIEEQYRQKRTEAMWQEWSQQNAATQAAAAAFEAFGNQASNSLTGIITGSMSASDALSSIGRTILNDVINTFVQMGVQQAKSAIMGGSVQQAQIASTTAAQVSGIGVQTAASTTAAATTTAAWTPAAIMSSVASFGGAVAIGLGAMAGIMALTGKRKNGGPVGAGGMYQMGEGNLPEFLQTRKGLFAVPGDKGRVFSNKDITGSPVIPRASTGKEYINNASSGNQQTTGAGQRQMQVNIQFFDQTTGGSHTLKTETSMDNGIAEVKAFLLDDQANNGVITRGYAAALGQRIVARGSY